MRVVDGIRQQHAFYKHLLFGFTHDFCFLHPMEKRMNVQRLHINQCNMYFKLSHTYFQLTLLTYLFLFTQWLGNITDSSLAVLFYLWFAFIFAIYYTVLNLFQSSFITISMPLISIWMGFYSFCMRMFVFWVEFFGVFIRWIFYFFFFIE